MAITHYDILGISMDATIAEIEQAYRQQVRLCHPDLFPNNEPAHLRFQQIQTAFDILHSPTFRSWYDLSLGPQPTTSAPNVITVAMGDGLEEGEFDSLRFSRQSPGVALVPYRRRNRFISLVEWLADEDFLCYLWPSWCHSF